MKDCYGTVRNGGICACPNCVRARAAASVAKACDREHVTSAAFQSLIRERHEAREEAEVQAARVRDLESKLAQCMADIDKARGEALEEAALTVARMSGHEANPYLAPGKMDVSQDAAVKFIRALKGAG